MTMKKFKPLNISITGKKGAGMSYSCICIYSCCVEGKECCSNGYCFKQKEYENSLKDAEK